VDEPIWVFDYVAKVSPTGVVFCSGVRLGAMSVGERLYSGDNLWARAMVWSFALKRRRIEMERVSTALAHSKRPSNTLIRQGKDAVDLLTKARWEWENALLDLTLDRSRRTLVHSR
jgi:hypothetical protein